MILFALAIAAIVLVAFLIWLVYFWVPSVRKEKEEAGTDWQHPPDERYDL